MVIKQSHNHHFWGSYQDRQLSTLLRFHVPRARKLVVSVSLVTFSFSLPVTRTHTHYNICCQSPLSTVLSGVFSFSGNPQAGWPHQQGPGPAPAHLQQLCSLHSHHEVRSSQLLLRGSVDFEKMLAVLLQQDRTVSVKSSMWMTTCVCLWI